MNIIRRKKISIAAAIITMLISIVVIIGWFFHNDFLKSIGSGGVNMKFNVALCFLFSSAALLFNYFPAQNKLLHRVSVLLPGIVFLLGLTLLEYVYDFNAGIDELFFKDEIPSSDIYFAGRMSPLSALNFLLIGIGLFSLNNEKTATYQFFYLSGITFVSFVMLIGFNFIADIPTFIRLSVNAAIGFITLSIALWFAQPIVQKKISFERKLFTGFAAVILLIVVLSIFSTYYNNKLVSSSRMVNHTNDVLNEAEQILSLVKDIESGERGYIVTDGPNYLDYFIIAKDSIFNHVRKLKVLTKNDPVQQVRVDYLSMMIDKRIDFSLECIQARNEKGFEAANALIATLEGRFYTDKIRNIIAAIQLQGKNLLVQLQNENKRSIISFNRAFLVFLSGVFLLLLVMVAAVLNNISVRKTAEKQSRENEAQIQSIFSAAPDAVIVIDDDGRIVKWNQKAAILFGWASDEVLGNLLSETIIPYRYRDAHENGMKHFLETGEGKVLGTTIEIQAINKNNLEFDVALSISPTVVHGKHLFIGFVRDITERKKIEQKITESSNVFSTLFYKSPAMKAIMEASSGKYIDVNDAFANFLEVKKEEILGKTAFELDMFGQLKESEQMMKNIQTNGFVRELETQLRDKHGKVRWVSTNIDIVNLNGTNCFLSDAIDITERKTGEEKLLKFSQDLEEKVLERTEAINTSEKRYRYLFENNPMPMWVIALDTFKFLDVNEMAILQYGYSREEFLAMTTLEIRPDEDKALFMQSGHLFEMSRTNYSKGVWNHRKKDGTIIEVETIGHRIMFEGVPARLILANDVTEKRKAEEKIKGSEKKLRSLIANSNEVVIITDIQGRRLFVSEAINRMLGYTPEEFAELNIFDTVLPEEAESVRLVVQKVVDNPHQPFTITIRILHKNGSWRWIEAVLAGFFDVPDLNGIVINYRDITGRKEAEEAILRAEMNYREIFNKASDGIYIHEIETGKVIEVNHRACEITGYSSEELLNTDPFEFLTSHPDYNFQQAISYLQKAATGEPQIFEWLIKNKDGSYNWLEFNLKKATIAGQVRILSFFRQINDRKKVQLEIQKLNEGLEQKVQSRTAELQKSNELFLKLFNYNPASIAISSLTNGKLINVNDSFLLLNGYSSKEEILGKNTIEVNLPVQPEQRTEIGRLLEKDKHIKNLELHVYDRQGNKKWIQLSAIMLEIDNAPCILSVSIDITERKIAEEHLMLANKELEAFSYSVSHDLRAPLRAIDGYSKMLLNNYHTIFDTEGKRLFSRITENANKMGLLIDNLLEFSRLGRKDIHRSLIEMTGLFETIIAEINTTINHKATVKIHNLHSINADSPMIKQVIINLLSNAIKYSSKTQHPFVEVKSYRREDQIIYNITDNGVGFDNQFVDKLFGVFHRLHSQSEFEGVGVGLALVKRIIEKHGGRVWAAGEMNKGATFCFSLPVENK